MFHILHRSTLPWFLIVLFSGLLWVVLSSNTVNAVHVLAKSAFSVTNFGSVNIWALVAGAIWIAFVGWLVVAGEIAIPHKKMILLGGWSALFFLAVLTSGAAYDHYFATHILLASFTTIADVLGAYLVGLFLMRKWLKGERFKGHLKLLTLVLSYLLGMHTLLLVLTPGVHIRLH